MSCQISAHFPRCPLARLTSTVRNILPAIMSTQKTTLSAGFLPSDRVRSVQEFLEDENDPPGFVSPKDTNDCTLGSLGNHNVVIAVLPDGEHGLTSATVVVMNMLHSFPNFRIGLMVGIGGGAPGKHGIRLGDIVVSAPCDGDS